MYHKHEMTVKLGFIDLAPDLWTSQSLLVL